MKHQLLIALWVSLLSACTSSTFQPDNGSQLAECIGADKYDRLLTVNIDDVGVHPDFDRAAFSLLRQGKAQTMSLMVPAPNFTQSAKLALQRNTPVGIHLTLTNEYQDNQPWGGVLPQSEVPSLYNEKGYLWQNKQKVVENATLADMRRELKAQIEKALMMGLNVTHIDNHQMVLLANDEFLGLYKELMDEYRLVGLYQGYLESPAVQKKTSLSLQQAGYIVPDVFYMQYNPDQRAADPTLAEREFLNMIRTMEPGLNHLILHPSFDTPSARSAMNDLDLRISDYLVWNGEKVHQLIDAQGIKLITLSRLRALKFGGSECMNPRDLTN